MFFIDFSPIFHIVRSLFYSHFCVNFCICHPLWALDRYESSPVLYLRWYRYISYTYRMYGRDTIWEKSRECNSSNSTWELSDRWDEWAIYENQTTQSDHHEPDTRLCLSDRHDHRYICEIHDSDPSCTRYIPHTTDTHETREETVWTVT